jgi:hypothetical protein
LSKLNFQVLRRTMARLAQGKGSVKDIQAHLRHAKADTTANEYMQELPESVGRMVESMYQELMHDQGRFATMCYQRGWELYRYLYERYGRHEETRTPDLYRVKGASNTFTTTYMVPGDCQVPAATCKAEQSWVGFMGPNRLETLFLGHLPETY